MPDMTPERAIEFLLHVTACSGPFDYFEPEQNEALRMGAAALAEVAALRAELAEAKAMLIYVPHGWCDSKELPPCPACARDARWPKKEGT